MTAVPSITAHSLPIAEAMGDFARVVAWSELFRSHNIEVAVVKGVGGRHPESPSVVSVSPDADESVVQRYGVPMHRFRIDISVEQIARIGQDKVVRKVADSISKSFLGAVETMINDLARQEGQHFWKHKLVVYGLDASSFNISELPSETSCVTVLHVEFSMGLLGMVENFETCAVLLSSSVGLSIEEIGRQIKGAIDAAVVRVLSAPAVVVCEDDIPMPEGEFYQ